MTWIASSPAPVDGPLTGADRGMLEGYLRFQRRTLLNVCAGLTGEQLALRSVWASNLSLLGLVRHLTKVERIWLRIRVADQDIPPFFDPELGRSHDFDHLDPATAEEAVRQLQEEWRLGDAAVVDVDFDHTVEAYGEPWSLRMVYVHLIGEYARHNGHADLLRESIDGATGR